MSKDIKNFKLEEYLATREFSAKYMFCGSDVESRTIGEVLKLLPEEKQNEFLDVSLAYTLPEGKPSLRAEIASMYQGIEIKDVLCLAGAEEGIYAAARCLLKEDDHAVAIIPCYQSLSSVAESICPVSQVAVEVVDGEWHLDVEKVAEAIQDNTKVLFCNFPHNPTGYIPSKETFAKLIQLVKDRDIILFSDEVYRGLELNPEHQLPSACEVYSKAISLGVMSKSLGFAGLRVGWVTCTDSDLLGKVGNYKHYLSICNSAPSEWLSEAILQKRELILEENLKLMRKNYQLVKSYFVSRSDIFQWVEPQGGCIAYPKYLGSEDIFEVADHLRHATGVVVLPDQIFEMKNQHFRVSFGRKNCEAALIEFAKFFAQK